MTEKLQWGKSLAAKTIDKTRCVRKRCNTTSGVWLCDDFSPDNSQPLLQATPPTLGWVQQLFNEEIKENRQWLIQVFGSSRLLSNPVFPIQYGRYRPSSRWKVLANIDGERKMYFLYDSVETHWTHEMSTGNCRNNSGKY